MTTLSPKQRELLVWTLDKGDEAQIAVWAGSIRSGKTEGAGLSYTAHTTDFQGMDFILAGRSIGALNRNVVPAIKRACATYQIPFDQNRSRQELEVGANLIHMFGANNESSQDTVQGMTAAGVLLDEAALLPQSFVMQALGRMSVDGAKAILTLNKTSPFHWIKREFLDEGELPIHYMESTLQDAPFISDRTKSFYESVFTGHYYDRFISNEWANPNGLVYPTWQEAEIPENIERYDLAGDWGTASVTAILLLGKCAGVWYACDEYYWDAKKQGIQRTAEEHTEAALNQFEAALPKLDREILDPSATSLRLAFNKKGLHPRKGNNDIDKGVQNLSRVLARGLFVIGENTCPNFKRELSFLSWDERKMLLGEERPVKQDDHACDAARYWAMNRLPPVLDMQPRQKPRGL